MNAVWYQFIVVIDAILAIGKTDTVIRYGYRSFIVAILHKSVIYPIVLVCPSFINHNSQVHILFTDFLDESDLDYCIIPGVK